MLFPFGHGLSYTSFTYGDLRVTPETLDGDGNVTVTCTVTNTGDRPGAEIVQLYVGERTPRVVRAPKELRGFTKNQWDPVKMTQVRFGLTSRDFAYWNGALAAWHVQSDTYRILVGSSSRDIRLEAMICITARPDFS